MNREYFESLLHKDFNLSSTSLQKLYLYYELLVDKSKVMNLTTITTLDGVYLKHFYDCLLMTKTKEFESVSTLIDVGSGAGFPGIVIAICYPSIQVCCLEPTLKRCNFLNEVINCVQLTNVTVVNDRAENYISNVRESFDASVARAVAPANILLELLTPFVKVGKYIYCLKGSSLDEELQQTNSLKVLSLEISSKNSYTLPSNMGDRTILVLQKKSKTKDMYPRTYAKIKKNPL